MPRLKRICVSIFSQLHFVLGKRDAPLGKRGRQEPGAIPRAPARAVLPKASGAFPCRLAPCATRIARSPAVSMVNERAVAKTHGLWSSRFFVTNFPASRVSGGSGRRPATRSVAASAATSAVAARISERRLQAATVGAASIPYPSTVPSRQSRRDGSCKERAAMPLPSPPGSKGLGRGRTITQPQSQTAQESATRRREKKRKENLIPRRLRLRTMATLFLRSKGTDGMNLL
jgi:hypothetical protein